VRLPVCSVSICFHPAAHHGNLWTVTDPFNSANTSANTRKLVLVLLLAAMLLRIIYGTTQTAAETALQRLPDQAEYLQLGRNLLHNHCLQMADPHFGDTVQAYRMPGYPMVIALCMGSIRAVRVAQGILDTSTVLAIYLLGRRWLSRNGAFGAAALVAFNPFLIYFSSLILSETLFTAMLAWGMVLLVWNRGSEGRSREEKTELGGQKSEINEKQDTAGEGNPCAVPPSGFCPPPDDLRLTTYALHLSPSTVPLLGALLLALTVLVRPGAALLPALLGLVAAGLKRHGGLTYPKWWPLPPATTGVALVLLALLPWGLRNYYLLDRWLWTASDRGVTLWDGFNDSATGASNQSRLIEDFPNLAGLSEIRRDGFLAHQAWQWINRHPAAALRLAGTKIMRTWSPWPLSSEYSVALYRLAGGIYCLPLDLLALIGLIRGGHASLSWQARLLLMIPALYFTLAHAVSVGSLRYRIPCEAPMAVVASAGLWACTPMLTKAFRRLQKR